MPVDIKTQHHDFLGQLIRFHRRKTGLSMNELADLAGVGKTVVFDIEHGKETIRFSTLKKILNILNISILLESPLMQHYTENNNEKS